MHRARAAARAEIDRVRSGRDGVPGASQPDYDTSLDLCRRDPALGDVVRTPQLAALAAATLGVERVRLLYDQLFAKPPGAVLTMWHQDQVYLPIDTSEVVEPG